MSGGLRWLVAAALACGAGLVQAHGGHGGLHFDELPRDPGATPFGLPGDPKRAARAVVIHMGDAGCTGPASIDVRRGETVLFSVRNAGRRTHEFVLGTSHELAVHAEDAEDDSPLAHDQSWILHVAAGRTGTLAWRFTRVGLFGFGCLTGAGTPAAMSGRIRVLR